MATSKMWHHSKAYLVCMQKTKNMLPVNITIVIANKFFFIFFPWIRTNHWKSCIRNAVWWVTSLWTSFWSEIYSQHTTSSGSVNRTFQKTKFKYPAYLKLVCHAVPHSTATPSPLRFKLQLHITVCRRSSRRMVNFYIQHLSCRISASHSLCASNRCSSWTGHGSTGKRITQDKMWPSRSEYTWTTPPTFQVCFRQRTSRAITKSLTCRLLDGWWWYYLKVHKYSLHQCFQSQVGSFSRYFQWWVS